MPTRSKGFDSQGVPGIGKLRAAIKRKAQLVTPRYIATHARYRGASGKKMLKRDRASVDRTIDRVLADLVRVSARRKS